MGRPRDLEARDRILTAAYELVTTPHADASINSIVARAGVGKATVYRWWNSRTAVVLDAFIFATSSEEPAAASPDPWDEVRQALHQLGEMLFSRPAPAIRDLLAAALRDEDEAEEIRETVIQGSRARLLDALTGAAEAGLLKPGLDPKDATDMLASPLWMRLLSDDDPSDVSGLIEQVLATVGQGIRA